MEPITVHELRTILGNRSYDAGLKVLSKGEASPSKDISDVTKIVMIGNKKQIAVVIHDKEGALPMRNATAMTNATDADTVLPP